MVCYMQLIDSFWSPAWERADLLALVCDDSTLVNVYVDLLVFTRIVGTS